MLFRPIRKKQNSLSFNNFFCLPCWNVIFTSRDVARGDYNVLSKIVTRGVSQSEKDIIWSHIIKCDIYESYSSQI
jgi:hypothetical protein